MHSSEDSLLSLIWLCGPGVQMVQFTENAAIWTQGLANELHAISSAAERPSQSALLWLSPLLPHQRTHLHGFSTCINPENFFLGFRTFNGLWEAKKMQKMP